MIVCAQRQNVSDAAPAGGDKFRAKATEAATSSDVPINRAPSK
jgi:hypothetical protein